MQKNLETELKGEFDVGEVNIRWSGEEEKPAGISKKKCALVVRKSKYSHVETKLYLCMMNTWRCCNSKAAG
jgi:hypothetical protein